jgi:hypothetical protein
MAEARHGLRSAQVLLLLAAGAAVAVLPGASTWELGSPWYWGVAGFFVVAVTLLTRTGRSWAVGSPNRRLVRMFLVGLPMVYVAGAIVQRSGGLEMAIQLAGLAAWGGLAGVGRRSDTALWAGCVAHAIWDAMHLGRSPLVPTWYVTACVAADVGVGAFVLMALRESQPASIGANVTPR